MQRVLNRLKGRYILTRYFERYEKPHVFKSSFLNNKNLKRQACLLPILYNSFDNSFSNPEFGEKKKKSSGDGSGGGDKKERGQPNPPQTPEQTKAILESIINVLPGASLGCTASVEGVGTTVGSWSITCTGTVKTSGSGGKP